MPALRTDSPIAVIGAGTMGAGIAQVAAAAGHPVLLYDAADGAAEKGKAGIGKALDRLVDKGRIDVNARDELLDRIAVASELDDLAPARLVVEAIVEDLGIKRKVFGKLEDICGDGAILATNTSSLSITAIGAGLARPERLVGMHFFNPAPVMALVEVVSGLATDPETAEIVFETAAAWGKAPVRARSTPGFIVNRVARPFYAEALRIYSEGGADPATIDAAMREAGGFRMGPFELMDLIGNDVNVAVTRSVFAAFHNDPRFQPSLAQEELVAAGRLGRKSGCGWYDYRTGATAPAPAIALEGPAPESVLIEGDIGPAGGLVERIRASGIPCQHVASNEPDRGGAIVTGGAVLRLTDGRMATEVAGEFDEGGKLVVFDLALDFGTASSLAVAPADQSSKAALAAASGLLRAIGIVPLAIDDIPGLIVMRTVAMLANEAADAVNQGVSDAAGVDAAMRNGVNYPRGPLAWADAIDPAYVRRVLSNLAHTYGEDRYRVSPLLLRKVEAGRLFHE